MRSFSETKDTIKRVKEYVSSEEGMRNHTSGKGVASRT